MGFITGRQIVAGSQARGLLGVPIADFNVAIANFAAMVACSYDLELVDMGYVIGRDTGATTAVSGAVRIGYVGALTEYGNFTIPTGLAAGAVRSVINKGIDWNTNAQTLTGRILPAGRTLLINYAGGSLSAGTAFVWIDAVPLRTRRLE